MVEISKALKDKIMELEGPVLVLGSGGFIGANLLRTILSVRDDCYGTVHHKFIPWRLVGVPAKNIIYTDLTIPRRVFEIFDKYAFKTIFNFAAYGGYSKQKDPEQIYATNVLGLSNLIEAASQKGFSAFVQAGSSSEYGLNSAAPREKDGALAPNSDYAVSKIASSYMVKYLGEAKKLPVINLRFYSIYGPYEEPDRFIPVLIRHGLEGRYPPLVEPEISRDFVYIDDAVEASVLAAADGVRKAPGAAVNIASGKKTTIRDAAASAGEIFDLKAEPAWQSMANKRWDLKDWYGDPALAKEILGWEARTGFKEGLQRTVEWTRAQADKIATSLSALTGAPLRLSAVIACYNDAQAVPVMYERLTRVFAELKVEYEIIFVNDASPDNTDQVLSWLSAKDNRVIGLEHSRNFGSQSSFLSGMKVATGDAVVLMDGDLQDPPELIADFFRQWQKGSEVVYGRRVKRESSRVLNFCYKAFYRLFRKASYVPIPLDAGDFSLMDRKVVNELLALPETDQFLRGLRAWVGFKQTGVDYTRPERMFGKSTNSWRKNFWWAKKAIFSFSFAPLELLSYFGIILTGVSAVALIAQIVLRFMFPDTPHGISTIIVLILFFGAVQVLAVSIVGEYLAKIFEESKKRPKFIRKSIRFGGRHYQTADEMETFLKGRRL